MRHEKNAIGIRSLGSAAGILRQRQKHSRLRKLCAAIVSATQEQNAMHGLMICTTEEETPRKGQVEVHISSDNTRR